MSLATGTFRPRGRKPRIPIRQPGHRLNEGLVFAMLAVEGAGTPRDWSPVPRQLGYVNRIAWEANAVLFNGSQYLMFPGTGIKGLQRFTWFVRFATSAYSVQYLLDLSSGGPWQKMNLGPNSDRYIRMTSTHAGIVTDLDADVEYETGRDYLVAVTYDGAAMRMHVNGRLAGSAAATGALTYTTVLNVDIGRRTNGDQNYFSGQISDARIWSRALSPDEIQELSMGLYEEFTPQIRRPMIVVPDLDVVRVTQLVRETLQAPASETQRITQVVREYLYSEGQRVTQFPVEMLVSNKDPYHRVTQYVVEMLVSNQPANLSAARYYRELLGGRRQ